MSASGQPAAGLHQIDEARWRDDTTGLVVTAAPAGQLHRVFQTQYQALNPPIPRGERALWSRWDVLDHVTLYGAEQAEAAIVEVLAYAKPAKLDLAGIFPDLSAGDDPVADEWTALGHMNRGQIARAWRVARQMTSLRLKPGSVSWIVDVAHAETIAVLRREVAQWAPDPALIRNPLEVDASLLAGGRRDVTTAIATWLRTRVLADGSEPSGVRFTSTAEVIPRAALPPARGPDWSSPPATGPIWKPTRLVPARR